MRETEKEESGETEEKEESGEAEEKEGEGEGERSWETEELGDIGGMK